MRNDENSTKGSNLNKKHTQPHQARVGLDLFAERSCCCKCGRQSIPECIAVARKRTAPMWSNCALKSGRVAVKKGPTVQDVQRIAVASEDTAPKSFSVRLHVS